MLRLAENVAFVWLTAACGVTSQQQSGTGWQGSTRPNGAGGTTAFESTTRDARPTTGGASTTMPLSTAQNYGGEPTSTTNFAASVGTAGRSLPRPTTVSQGGTPSSQGHAGHTAASSVAPEAGRATTTSAATCSSLPPVDDYGATGPFSDAKMFTNVGPSRNYTVFRPDTSLGKAGFLHPIGAWGNGISTTPDMYQKTLSLVASHGFVIIACNDTQAEEPCLSSGLNWLVQQNTVDGPLAGKLDTANEVILGYSWGGGASLDTSVRPNVRATVSLHGMPPRNSPWGRLHAPILLFTSTGDHFVTASEYVTPNYESSTVQTFYATLSDANAGHLYVVDEGAAICIGALLASTFGSCGNAALERAPTIAWLRAWSCSDQNAKRFFYGDHCSLCENPWTKPQRKLWQ